MTPGHARSRRPRRSVIVASIVVVLAALGGLSWVVLHSRYFAVTTVTVRGERHEAARAVIDAAGLATSPPMISVDPSSIEAALEARFAWIATVRVTQSWPHTVSIEITERTPVAVIDVGHATWELVDRTGRVLGAPAPRQVLPRLEVAGATPSSTATATVAATERAGLAVAATLPVAFASQVAVITVDAQGSVSLRLTTPLTFVLGPPSELSQKYEDIAAVIDHATVHEGDVVDVSVPQAMTVTGP